MKKSFFIPCLSLLVLSFLFIYILAKSYSDLVFSNISSKFIRFHVVANSNSTEDQIIKYEIRDAIMQYMSSQLCSARTKEEAVNILNRNISQIEQISNDIIQSKNMNYNATITLGCSKFPTKDYSDFVLPEGTYDALKVELGKADGQNWWCILFPSICIPQGNELYLQNDSSYFLNRFLDSESLSIISKTSSATDIKIKFKLIELFENI